MTRHPTDSDVQRFAAHTLDPELVLEVGDHLAVCDHCRTRLSRAANTASHASALRTDVLAIDEHISDDQVQRWVTGLLTGDEQARLQQHLTNCEPCIREVRDLRDWVAVRRRQRRTRFMAAAAAMAALIVLPLAFRTWQQREPFATAVSLPGLEGLPQEMQSRVRSALEAGSAQPPAAATGDIETLMGRGPVAATTFDLVAPLTTVTVSDRPVFRWGPLATGAEYVVAVFDTQLAPVIASGAVTATEWTPPEPLVRGRSYLWQVTGRSGGDSVTVPSPPAPLARFAVMDAQTASILDELSQTEPQSHVLLGIAYTQAGAREEAISHLRQAPESDPHIDVVRRTLDRWNAETRRR